MHTLANYTSTRIPYLNSSRDAPVMGNRPAAVDAAHAQLLLYRPRSPLLPQSAAVDAAACGPVHRAAAAVAAARRQRRRAQSGRRLIATSKVSPSGDKTQKPCGH